MEKQMFYRIFAAAVVLLSGTCVRAQEVVWEETGGGQKDVSAFLQDPRDDQRFYLGSSQGVFSSKDAGRSWTGIFSLKNRQVRDLAFDGRDQGTVLAATQDGLFRGPGQDGEWALLFRGRNSLEKDCRALLVRGGRVYLGTMAGLFVSNDGGKNWRKQPGELGRCWTLSIVSSGKSPSPVYAACVNGLFLSGDDSLNWKKVFRSYQRDEEENSGECEDENEEDVTPFIRCAAVDPRDGNHVYLATRQGILESGDGGQSWEKISDQGLLDRDVRYIVPGGPGVLYAASKNRIFIRRDNIWREFSVRLDSPSINRIFPDSRGTVYAATTRGLFRSSGSGFIRGGDEEHLLSAEGGCPPINEVHSAAMRFAEVEPGKIIRWRELARKKAWLPKMNIGVNRDTGDLWHWESGSSTKDGDDLLRKGRDSLEWDVSLTWDLSDLVWNESQTAIDVRSRLTVELRNDILDEVTKLYFERIRVISELSGLDVLEKKKMQEKRLRVRELNAYLDGLTGGYFSAGLKEKKG